MNSNAEAPENLRAFQLEFGQYLRAPKQGSRPKGVPKRRSEVYEELLFNNLCGFIDRCYPVAQSLFTQANWQRLNRNFFRDWRCSTPYFSQIPFEFLNYVAQGETGVHIPAWMPELMHYEWMELDVDTEEQDCDAQPEGIDNPNTLFVNRALRNLAYEWPVHRISSSYRPRKKQLTYLLVYRKKDFSVNFLEINAVTAILIQRLIEQPQAGLKVLNRLAEEMQHAQADALVLHGQALLQDLIQKEILFSIGSCE